jgi:ethanolamine utilization cobalamin adenosyltransferase
VHVLTSSDHPPQACCELCHQPVGKKPDTLTHLTADTLVAKNDPRLAFRAVLDSTIALTVWLQIELAEPWQPWLTDIRSRLGNIMRADALEEPLAAQSIAGFSEDSCIVCPISRCATWATITWCRRPPWARCRAA